MKARRVSLMMAAIGAALVLGAGAAACCYACGVANPLAAAGGLFSAGGWRLDFRFLNQMEKRTSSS